MPTSRSRSKPSSTASSSLTSAHRRKQLSAKLGGKQHTFDARRPQEAAAQHQQLRDRLQAIMDETDEVYQERLADLQETRDYGLMELNLTRQYALSKSWEVHSAELAQIDAQNKAAVSNMNKKLLDGLQSHVKRFKDDKSLWDVSSESTADLGLGLGMPGITSISLSSSGGGGGSGGIPKRSGQPRKAATSKGKYYDYNSGSGSESGFQSNRGGNGTATGDNTNISTFLSGVESDTDNNRTSTGTRIRNQRNVRATRDLGGLKNDEVVQDLSALTKRPA